ncbi:MAG: hypothetical protein JRJ87_15665 [Deltaproteobacteria bacterium]|nr:hypothetical protein [Deltaproteobacteria bacterium]
MKNRFLFWLVAGIVLSYTLPAMGAPQPMSRTEIINLAKSGVDYSYYWGHGNWRMDGAQLGSCSGSCPNCTHSGSYGADCSGFAAKVWQVPSPSDVTVNSHPYNTGAFRYNETHWDQISRDNAQAGDALVYRNSTNTAGHIVVYESGDAWGSSWVYEARGCSYGIVHNLKSISSSYVAIRRHLIDDTPANGNLVGVVFQDDGNGDMTVRIPGASLTLSGGGSTIARAEDAFWSFSLPPGTYNLTAASDGFESDSRQCTVTAGNDTWCSVGLMSVCVPDCAGRACGSDPLCGVSCGSCPAGQTCDAQGKCVCVPNCSGLECGPDPVCGTSCGSCPADHECNPAGVCQEIPTCSVDCSGRECGPDPVCGLSCGLCAPEQVCSPAGSCNDLSNDFGKIYGYVVKLEKDEEVSNLSHGRPIGDALIRTDSDQTTVADEHGYFEMVLLPGEYTLTASADGCLDGQASCEAKIGGSTECFVPVYAADEKEDLDQIIVRGGCATAGTASGWFWPLGLFFLLVFITRRDRLRA